MAPHLMTVTLALTCFLVFLQCGSAAPRRPYFIEVEDPDNMIEVLSRLGRSLIRASEFDHSSKRGVDFGLGRGFSGTQAAKHLMGLAAANYPVGPGRKKRSQWSSMASASAEDDDTATVDNPQSINMSS